ncbi:MAG: rhodanese-like domain-containing protein [Chloroflexi bacterium]|nr:rhodanese-like domain-containing protein [Chloroflexota bacterium]
MRTTLNVPRILVVLLILAILVSACAAPTPTPVPPTATPVPPTATPKPALDLSAVLDKYLSALPAGFGGIAPAALNEQIAAAKPFILDVREASEITTNGTIAGAVNIPIRDLAKNLDKLPAKDQPIVAMCAIGHRGAMAMETLQLLGYTNVKSLSNGFNAWKAANLPVAAAAAAMPAAGQAPAVDKDLLAALDKYLSALPAGFGTIAPAALNEQMAAAKPFILDVRETTEVASGGAIAGAVNIPIREVLKNLAKLPAKDQPIVAVCGIGHRGAMTMMALQALGYTNVKSLAGGMTAWNAANLPVVK